MKKLYNIKITGSDGHPGIWYAKHIGEIYQAELGVKRYGEERVVFKVNETQYVYPFDCIIIGEIVIEQYVKH